MELTPIIKESFTQYAGMVLQSRALVDVRDCIKPSARQIFFSMLERKLVHKNPHKKTANAVGMAMADYYIHGDSSCEGIIMRAAQPFSMRYPLVDTKGNKGTLLASGDWAAQRYTESRLGEICDILFADIKKDTITDWRDNYDNSKQYPGVLPSKGFYNIVNGSSGIGVGMASSIAQYNLNEVNEALIKLLWNPNIPFEEIYCAPDFATGGILLNEEEVKEAMKNGRGKACKLRAVVEFDSKERCFIVTEIPYSVYTNTICGELEAILDSEDNPGIERFNDLTGAEPNIKIYLSKKANADKVLRYLYKNTSLQSHYGINMTMLDNGRFPRVFGWKEALQAHLNHEIEVYTRGFKFDLRKIEERLHIIEALLRAIASIEEVVQTIKSSASTAAASIALQKLLTIDEVQAKAILDIKLSRLAHLEIDKLLKEQAELTTEKDRITAILNDNNLLFKEIENGLREVAKKFGDARRTKIMNIEQENDEPTEVKSLLINLTNQNNLFVSEASSLYTQRRGGVGSKFKLNDGEFVVSTIAAESTDTILFFTDIGNYYHYMADKLIIDEKLPIESIISIRDSEMVCALTTFNKYNSKHNIILFTKNGMMKKSAFEEYNTKRSGGAKAIELEDGDEVVSAIFANDEKVGILTTFGQFLICETKDVRPIGRTAKGVKAIKLNLDDNVVSVHTVPAAIKEFISVSGNGYIKRTSIDEFSVQGRYTKGKKLQKLTTDTDYMIDFLPLSNDKEVIITSTRAQVKVSIDDIPILSRDTQGVKSIKMSEKDSIIGLSKF